MMRPTTVEVASGLFSVGGHMGLSVSCGRSFENMYEIGEVFPVGVALSLSMIKY
jgi:hypothetical protein